MSLFKDGLMRKPTKAVLRNALLTEKADVDPNALHVLDGGALLHKVRWSTSVTYREVCDLYVNHIKSKYGIGTIVFDGYMDGPSTKDHEHARRSLNKRRCADVQCNLSTKSGNKVIKCDEDADTEIVRCALYVAETGRKVNVVADDTDIPAQIKSYLLVLHAWTGCDTTSAIHSKGKNSLLRKLKTSQHLRSLMDILSDKNADQVEVGAAGIELFLYMYGGNQTLTKLRYYKFMDMAAKGEILPENLAPTERAAVQHSLRVHQQVVVWQTLNDVHLDLLQWGWKQEGPTFIPIQTDSDVAPSETTATETVNEDDIDNDGNIFDILDEM
ncbi:hypothetical protein GQR58_011692 [Nymphon striatum]|nr:hypothetical protein GQR58_011692 [Nymphon striatum]